MKKTLVIYFLTIFISPLCLGQSNSEEKVKPVPASVLDKESVFDFDCQEIDNPYICFSVFIDENLSLTDSILTTIKNLNGGGMPMTVISFVIEQDSSITNINLSRGIGRPTNEYLSALKVAVSNSPAWVQGEKEGVRVRTEVSMPYTYKRYSKR